MADDSRLVEDAGGRPLRPVERELLEAMLAGEHAEPELQGRLNSCLVADMRDGGMGSIRFLSSGRAPRRFGKALAQAEYVDENGVLVSIVVTADDTGDLYEVDFWKVDFSPLRRYPVPSELKLPR
ncbi:MAG: hypothetical protein ABSB35_22885 [Bryobacteraceae bacterium]|jgi:hypothetical protein